MTLVPPTHGRAGVRSINSRVYLAAVGEERLRQQMLSQMNRVFQDELGVDVPEAWLSWEIVESPNEVDVRLSATAPTRAQEVLTPSGVRTFTIALTTGSQIPIVPRAYHFDNPYRHPDHYLTFKGWDAETGLMVFDR